MRRLLFFVVLAVAPNALALGFELDAAGGYWFAGSPQFQARLGVHQQVSRLGSDSRLVIGFKAGVLLHSAGTRLGIPIDLSGELHFGPVFFAIVGGPYVHFNDGDVLRAHIGGEFGVLLSKTFRLSLEVSWLQPSPLLLGRFGIRF